MVKDELLHLGHAISKTRVEKHVTQAEIGRRAGLHTSHVSRIERGLGNPRLNPLLRLADALETTLGALLSKETLLMVGSAVHALPTINQETESSMGHARRWLASSDHTVFRQRSWRHLNGPRKPGRFLCWWTNV